MLPRQTTRSGCTLRPIIEPIVGETYHLYEGSSGDFLSIIPPNGKDPMWEAIGLLRILNGKSSPTNKQPCPTRVNCLQPFQGDSVFLPHARKSLKKIGTLLQKELAQLLQTAVREEELSNLIVQSPKSRLQ